MHARFLLVSIVLLCIVTATKAQPIIVGGGAVAEDPYPDAGYYILPCWNDHQDILPLTDLGTGYYMGIQGGLFPGGSNTDATSHLNLGKNISKSIKPLNVSDSIDYATGEIILTGIGASVASDAYNNWKLAMIDSDWVDVNKCLNVKSTFIGGKTMTQMLDPEASYWDNFLATLASKGIAPSHVQIAWMLLQSEIDTNEVNAYIDTVADEFTAILQNLYLYLPNLKEVFISGIHYTGYTAPEHKRYDYMVEPFGYWSNLAIKEVIARQINGDPELDPDGVGKVAPYITWGPYFWADGINPRATDGLTWPCENFRDDTTGGGFHLKPEYQFKEGTQFSTFFSTNPVAKIWYNQSASWNACPGIMKHAGAREEDERELPEATLEIYPVPAHSEITISVPTEFTHTTGLFIYNSTGKLLYQELFDARTALDKTYSIQNLPVGIYYIQLISGNNKYTGNFVKQ